MTIRSVEVMMGTLLFWRRGTVNSPVPVAVAWMLMEQVLLLLHSLLLFLPLLLLASMLLPGTQALGL